MDIEDLSKSQLLLLTLLVNFVTSIATGILTVSLLDQAPPTITQTVNRIVDHTIETVATQVPVIGTNEPAAPTTEQLLTAAIAASAARTVTIHRDATTTDPLAFGIYLPSSRTIVAVAPGMLPSDAVIGFARGAGVSAPRVGSDEPLFVYRFAADASIPSAPKQTLVKASDVKQGQTVIGLTADGSAVTGIVSKVDAEGIHANVPGVPAGAAIVNLSGEIIGIGSGSGDLYFSTDRMAALVAGSAAP